MSPLHFLSGKTAPKTPAAVVCFDTETSWADQGEDRVQTLRCWDACTVYRTAGGAPSDHFVHDSGESMAELRQCVERASEASTETFVFAHNVGFDLTVTQLPWALSLTGWTLKDYNLAKENTWLVYQKDGRRLVVCDSYTWVRCSLAEVGRDLRRRKLELPANDAPLTVWHKRCRKDVEILTHLVLTLLDWWDENGSGRFGVTGSSCGWSMMRAKIRPRSILVGPVEERTAFERKAIYSGRKESFRVGHFLGGVISDYDFVAAYPTVVARLPLPAYCLGPLRASDRELAGGYSGGKDVIADCVVTTARPCVPARAGGLVYWPTGRFNVTLSGPEIAYARECGASVEVGEGYLYQMTYALAPFAEYLLGLQGDYSGRTPAVVRRMAKGWGRSVPGRFAGRTSQLIMTRRTTGWGWHLETGMDQASGLPIELLTIDGIERTRLKNVDGRESSPAVFAFVESYCRAALGRVLDKRNPHRLLTAETDGWLEHRPAGRSALTIDRVPYPFTVIRKGHYREAEIFGPDHIEIGGERRFAGIPRRAVRTGNEGMTWHDWPGVDWQMEHSEPGIYRQPRRKAVQRDHYAHRFLLVTSETVPPTMRLDAAGENELVPWSETDCRLGEDTLTDYQIPQLADLVDQAPRSHGRSSELARTLPGRLPYSGRPR